MQTFAAGPCPPVFSRAPISVSSLPRFGATQVRAHVRIRGTTGPIFASEIEHGQIDEKRSRVSLALPLSRPCRARGSPEEKRIYPFTT